MTKGRYPGAVWTPWKYESESGPTYYRGMCDPIAVVNHIMQGYHQTALEWARQGHYGASWHFTIARDGRVWQHLELNDGGYHAGIGANRTPSWKLWKGHDFNINGYTIGIEHEGKTGEPYPAAQMQASAKLAAWLCEELGIPADRDHLIGHYEIDSVDRPNDPGPTWPWDRYIELVEAEMGMTEAQVLALIKRCQEDKEDDEVTRLGASQIDTVAALVARQRAMGRATTLEEVIAANDPNIVPG